MEILLVHWAGNAVPRNKLFCPDLSNDASYYSIPYLELQRSLGKFGIVVESEEYFSNTNRASAVISVDLPQKRCDLDRLIASKAFPGCVKILIVMESPIARPELLSSTEFKKWDFVFHYNEELAGRGNILKYELPSNLDFLHKHGPDYRHDKPRLVGMMATNKPSKLASFRSNPLAKVLDGYKFDYSAGVKWLALEDGLRFRRKIANTFARILPNDFRIFGGQWDGSSYAAHHRLFKPKANPCSVGHSFNNTISIIKGFKFFFAIENSTHADGYLTEKLFSVIRAGSVPLYRPKRDSAIFPITIAETELPFIDLRRYQEPLSLIHKIRSLSPASYACLRRKGNEFLVSELARVHTPSAFSKHISECLVQLLR